MRGRISFFVTMGDSLSDPGRLEKRRLLGIIPMGKLSHLDGRSPLGAFTNGYVWVDHLSALLANQFIIEHLKKTGYSAEDISEDIIVHRRHEEELLREDYNLDDFRGVRFNGHDFFRSFDEGGLMAHNYRLDTHGNPKLFFTRLAVVTLGEMRRKMLEHDEKRQRSDEHKAQTLVIEWSGANDLITVNTKPTKREVMLGVNARIKNLQELIKHGYKHFVLFDLPDISLTPRYQLKPLKERQDVHDLCELFNVELKKACRQLQKQHFDCTIDTYNISGEFQDMYENPEKYKLDKDKLNQPYTTSMDFKITPDHLSPAPGYMFWDDIHPTSHVHALLADRFYRQYEFKFTILPPADAERARPMVTMEAP